MTLHIHRLLLALPLAFCSAGCPTPVVYLPVSDVAFTEVYSAGITPPASSCEGTDGSAIMRVALRTSEKAAITPDTVLDGATIDFGRDSITFSDSAIFDLPDSECDAGCAQSFSCITPPAIDEQDYERCANNNAGLSASGDPRFVSKTDETQLFGVMLEFTTSWRGQLPEELTNLSPDFDGDGRGDLGANIALQGFDNERATDRQDRRLDLVSTMATSAWNDVRSNALQAYGTETFFGFWTFGSSGAVTQSRVAALGSTADDTEFVSSNGRAVAAINSVDGNEGDAAQAAIFESMVTVLGSTNGYAKPEFADAEKILTVIVDGPDGLRLPDFDADRVIAAANAIAARVFIVHVDTPVQTTGTNTSTGDQIDLFPDDPEYVEIQGAGFASEADCDCKNFESCRAVTQYGSQPGSTNDVPALANAANLFCVPEYGEDGRIGPVDDYARIACATGGGYIYIPDIGDIEAQAAWLPYALDGLWEIPVDVEAVSRGFVTAGEPYLLQTNLSVELGGDRRTYSHLPNPGANTPGDRRAVVFAK